MRVTLALLACVCSLLQMCALQQLPCAMAQTDSHEGVECARRCQLDFFPSAVLVNASTGREDFTAQGACVYGCTCTHPESCEGFCKEGTGQTRFLSSGLFVDFGRDLNTQEFYVGCMLGCRSVSVYVRAVTPFVSYHDLTHSPTHSQGPRVLH